VSRSERQREQIRAAIARGHYARALVLAREHLAEFPDDEVVRNALAEASAAWGSPRLHESEVD
jgi:Flp pilus assembly protein TadD